MSRLVVQSQWKFRDDTLGDVRGAIDLIPLVEDRDFIGGSSVEASDATRQRERSVTAQEKTRRGRDRQH